MKVLRDLILATLATLAVILAVEAGLRLAQDRYGASFYRQDPQRGYALRPKAEGWYVVEGAAYVRVNSAGLRDRERRTPRPPHTLRVAVVGSSEAAAFEVPQEQTFAAAMERNLGRELEPRVNRVEVLNFGVPGYSLSQQYLTLKDHVWDYDPQVVLLLWNEYNLLRNTRDTNPGSDTAPLYVLRDGRLEPADPESGAQSEGSLSQRKIAIKGMLADWMNRSYLLCMLRQASVELGNQIQGLKTALRRNFDSPADASSGRAADYVQWWPYQPDLPEVQEDWKIGEAFLLEMKRECDRHGAELRLVIVDEQMQSHPDVAARQAFMQRWGLPSLDESDKRLERFCGENGIGVLALAPPMGAYSAAHKIAVHGGGTDGAGHWNILGNRLASRLITDELLTNSPTVRAWMIGGK